MHIREATIDDASAIARIHVESWKSTYSDLIPQEYLDSFTIERRQNLWQRILSRQADRNFVYVAVNDAGEIVGFANGGKERDCDNTDRSEIYAIYLLQDAQGQGIGTQLTAQLVKRLLAAGYKSLIVWVLQGNPAEKFYAALGGQYIQQKNITMGRELIEVAYGWDDLSMIVEKQA